MALGSKLEAKPYVVYWNNKPAPYMVERFNAVADRGNLNFEAWFNDRSTKDRTWVVDERTWRFKYRYLPALTFRSERYRFPLALISRSLPDILVSLYAEPSFLCGWGIGRLRGLRHALWVEVTFDRWVRRSWWKELIKRYVFSHVRGIITVGEDGRRFARRYNAPDERIFYARHTVDVEHFSSGRSAALPDREKFRAELCLGGVTFVYVGRLWWGKGVNYLLDAFAEVQQRLQDSTVSLLLLGDGADERKLREQCRRKSIQNVVFAGFKQKPELPPYYAASDVFVFPTLGDPYGLVVDEAMACSLPIISTSEAGEIRDRVEEAVNGYIVPPEDPLALADKMQLLARDPEARARMGAASFEKIKDHTPEGWAKDFEAAVAKMVSTR